MATSSPSTEWSYSPNVVCRTHANANRMFRRHDIWSEDKWSEPTSGQILQLVRKNDKMPECRKSRIRALNIQHRLKSRLTLIIMFYFNLEYVCFEKIDEYVGIT